MASRRDTSLARVTTAEVEARVSACKDGEQVDCWAERVLDANSVADVFA